MVSIVQGVQELLIAAALGGLIGLEREFGRKVMKKDYPFGIRTTMLLCLLGLLFVFLGEVIDLTVSVVTGLASVIIFSVLPYFIRKSNGFGLTSNAAIIISYVVGVLVGFKQYLIAIAISVLTTALLSLRQEMHSVVKLLTKSELKSAIQFFIIAFIILPLLPDVYLDFLGVFNPFRFWLVVVIISAISFFSYLSLKASNKGLAISGFISGLISTKAAAVKLASIVKEDSSLRNNVFNSILLSITSTMVLALVISFIRFFDLSLVKYLFLPLFIPAMIVLFFFTKKSKKFNQSFKLKKPFSVIESLKFALLLFSFIVIFTFISRFVDSSLIYVAVLLSALVSSLASIASITSMAASGQLSMPVAGNLLVFACVISLLDKMVYVKAGKDKKLNSMMMKAVIAWAVMIICLLLVQNFLMPF